MPRSARRASTRTGYRDRHGRGMRSAVTGPHLPPLRTRLDFFDVCVASAVEYLRTLWPEELVGVRFDIAAFPPGAAGPDGVDRWSTDPRRRRVTLYRVPIERLVQLHRDDDWHRRSYIESCVFRAVAELLGKDPWDIAPERYRHF
ncbi:metallopeptidase family protein [Protaetiibacter mangrovi]|uniref:Metallopeptidase family protein n=1 Tax=Protaetiibacter mangrovi TaxID=2970926 RepID=A0ABT1ZFM9_9MICO|nr:metallopeptidase family protein [Protaetiibacter mangrovi]MCS0499450.1 metallopeptidase family protein [Protaetiibacter mangrovi]TPX03512.1 metallopeptidase family protein [Schumannella luteola]